MASTRLKLYCPDYNANSPNENMFPPPTYSSKHEGAMVIWHGVVVKNHLLYRTETYGSDFQSKGNQVRQYLFLGVTTGRILPIG